MTDRGGITEMNLTYKEMLNIRDIVNSIIHYDFIQALNKIGGYPVSNSNRITCLCRIENILS